MSAPTPTATPVQWMRAFAHTPDPTRSVPRNSSHHQPREHVPRNEDDALPTLFRARPRSRRQAVSVTNSNSVLAFPGAVPDVRVSRPCSTVPTKCKRRGTGRGTGASMDREAPSLASVIPDSPALSKPPTHDSSSTQRRTGPGNTRSRTRATTVERSGLDHVRASSPRASSRSRRVVLDAVEIVRKGGSQDRMAECPTKRARKVSSHYPSPPNSRADRHVAVDNGDTGTHIPHPARLEREEHASPERTLPLKMSKYFARVSDPPTRSMLEYIPALTPPSSPMLTIPVNIESSDFEYPPLDASLDEPVDGAVNESKHIPTKYNTPGLFDDLMIMLRRLKPILVQETVRDDPWKVLIAVRLLNVTTGKAAIPVFCKIISRWPTPQDLVHAPHDELVELLRPLGLYHKRADWLKSMSERFLEDGRSPNSSRTSLAVLLSEECVTRLDYPGVGPYALDSLRIFCASHEDAWKRVMPRDKELIRYLRWRWAVEEGRMWYPGGTGVVGDVEVPYLIMLVDELAAHYDGTIGGEGYMYHFCNDLSDVLNGETKSY